MTPQEFKAWFDGFAEGISGVPSKAQWTRIKERVAEIDGKPITERYFIDRYWPTYTPPIYYTVPTWRPIYSYNTGGIAGTTFNATTAMYTLGKADSGNLGVLNGTS